MQTAPPPLPERLRQRGWHMTSQRRVIATVLVGDHLHLTADDVHAASQAILPEISRATVYNTLNELVAMGELLEISVGPGPRRYDANVRVPHHHLACVGCGALRDVLPSGAGGLSLPPDQQHGFDLDGVVDIVFWGACPSCATSPRT